MHYPVKLHSETNHSHPQKFHLSVALSICLRRVTDFFYTNKEKH